MEVSVNVLRRQQTCPRANIAVGVESILALRDKNKLRLDHFDSTSVRHELEYVGRLAKLTGPEYATSVSA